MTSMLTGGSLLQSSFHIPDQSGNRNFEAVVYLPRSNQLQHYYRIHTRPDRGWEKGPIINATAPVTGPGWIIQSRFGKEGNFEVVVPEHGGLVHYWHDNDVLNSPWKRFGVIAPGSTSAGAIVQNRLDLSLEVVVLHRNELYHYRRERQNAQWIRSPQPITRQASGPPALIQSDYSNHLEVAIPEGDKLVLYWRDHEKSGGAWNYGGILATGVTGPAGFVQGPFGSGQNKNFEIVVPQGDRLSLFWRDNSLPDRPMRFGGYVIHSAGQVKSAALAVSTFSTFADHLEVLTQEVEQSVFHYHRFKEGDKRRWIRSACLRIDEGSYNPKKDQPLSEKVVQLTGDWDYQHNVPVRHITETKYGIRGTDLGSSFKHKNRTYFLFGDTHWKDNNPPGTADSIAYTTDSTAWNGLNLTFHKSYMRIRFGTDATEFDKNRQGEYDVPLDGFSFQGNMYVFFSTDHFENRKVMGRSVLTICMAPDPDFEHSTKEQPLEFQFLVEFSSWKFINVSVQLVDRQQSARYHLPESRQGLLIWGSGGYRADNLYLAYLALDQPPMPNAKIAVSYFSGLIDGQPQWRQEEEDAKPLFYPAALGEISVRWNPVLRCWVLMYMAGPEDPIGAAVTMRVSRTPWGPWSERRKVLDWVADGMGVRYGFQSRTGWFIHNPGATPPTNLWNHFPDDLADYIIQDRPGLGGGGAYAPYQLADYTHGSPNLFLYYVLSTWNPYQVVLMKHTTTWVEIVSMLRLKVWEGAFWTILRRALVEYLKTVFVLIRKRLTASR